MDSNRGRLAFRFFKTRISGGFRMVRRVLLLLAAATLFAAPALAKRSKVPAIEAGTVRETPAADGKVVVEVKKGDNLLVLGKQGDWSQVMTDGGKKGWVLSKT